MFIPVSLRGVPKFGEEYEMTNTISPLFINLPIMKSYNSIENSYKFYTKFMKKYKTPYEIFINPYATILLMLTFPQMIFKYFMKVSEKPSFFFSNVPGPTNSYEFMSYTTNRTFFFVRFPEDLQVGFTLFTYKNNLIFGCQSDAIINFSPKKFVKIMTNNIKQNFIDT